MNTAGQTLSVKQKLFDAGAELFAEKGFDSVTVREICKRADTSLNMIHHYYGNKQGLFDTIVETFTEKVFAFPIRLIEKEIRSKEEFVTLMELFFEETLSALIQERTLLQVVHRHNIDPKAMTTLLQSFVHFLSVAQSKGFVQQGIEPELMSGFVMDRLATQVLYSKDISRNSAYDLIGDPEYRDRWTRSNLNLFLYGTVSR